MTFNKGPPDPFPRKYTHLHVAIIIFHHYLVETEALFLNATEFMAIFHYFNSQVESSHYSTSTEAHSTHSQVIRNRPYSVGKTNSVSLP